LRQEAFERRHERGLEALELIVADDIAAAATRIARELCSAVSSASRAAGACVSVRSAFSCAS